MSGVKRVIKKKKHKEESDKALSEAALLAIQDCKRKGISREQSLIYLHKIWDRLEQNGGTTTNTRTGESSSAESNGSPDGDNTTNQRTDGSPVRDDGKSNFPGPRPDDRSPDRTV